MFSCSVEGPGGKVCSVAVLAVCLPFPPPGISAPHGDLSWRTWPRVETAKVGEARRLSRFRDPWSTGSGCFASFKLKHKVPRPVRPNDRWSASARGGEEAESSSAEASIQDQARRHVVEGGLRATARTLLPACALGGGERPPFWSCHQDMQESKKPREQGHSFVACGTRDSAAREREGPELRAQGAESREELFVGPHTPTGRSQPNSRLTGMRLKSVTPRAWGEVGVSPANPGPFATEGSPET